MLLRPPTGPLRIADHDAAPRQSAALGDHRDGVGDAVLGALHDMRRQVVVAQTCRVFREANSLVGHCVRLFRRGGDPFLWNWLRALITDDFLPAGLLFGADRGWVLAEFRSECHGFLDGRALADFFQPALYVGELLDVD